MIFFVKHKWKIAALSIIVSLIVIQILFIINKPWVSDYWEHKAVFLELYRVPSHPHHPIVGLKEPHAFYSPYFVTMAFLGRALFVNPDEFFDIIVLFNLLFFIVAVFLLGQMVIQSGEKAKSFVLLLVSVFFLWGAKPPYYSSFYHFISSSYTFVYPATFAFCLSVFSAFLFWQINRNEMRPLLRFILLPIPVFINWVILLTHSLTFIFCCSLFLYLSLQEKADSVEVKKIDLKRGVKKLIVASLFFILPLLFAKLWKYYPFWDLLVKGSINGRFHSDSKVLYTNLFSGYYALILPLLFLLYDAFWNRDQKSRIILITVAMLLVVYCYGALSKAYGYGRSIAFIAVWIQVGFVFFIMRINYGKKLLGMFFITGIMASLFCFVSVKSVVKAASTTHKEYLNLKSGREGVLSMPAPGITHRLFFAKRYVNDGALVMTDLVTSRYAAAFGGKVIANPYSEYWINDNEKRMNDLNDFFFHSDSANRILILKKYKPRYLLINPDINDFERVVPKELVGGTVIRENGYTLIPLKF
ncbi:hypothetical protein IQ13_3488 [Lacibacter cauensis]|uniref:4-amino-4-deoxy-L-arabinose transferase-like glycosyltransferase n=1 Tax=Lacibacter cauensis TaxID=510947 RepID=A0A562SED6_9BACT|nr:hypothetical protein [Lacibacter cauensis]TWI79090.1 hypothetical protein IQ13_3488 [Lacibacter cauensis]